MSDKNYRDNQKKLSWEAGMKQSNRRIFDRFLKTYLILGLFAGLVGTVLFVYLTFDFNLNDIQTSSLWLAVSGFTLSITTSILLYLRREYLSDRLKRLYEFDVSTDFFSKWLKFEEAGKMYLESRNIEFNEFSVREILEHLLTEKIITKSEMSFLEYTIRVRNSIAHGQSNIPINIIEEHSFTLNELTQKVLRSL